MRSTTERLQLLKESLLEPNFFQQKGLGNELSFYIFDYDPKDEVTIRQEFPDLLSFVARDILQATKAEMREAFVGGQVDYIFHDAIDATGDNASSEDYLSPDRFEQNHEIVQKSTNRPIQIMYQWPFQLVYVL